MLAALDSLVESMILMIPTVSRRPIHTEWAIVDTRTPFKTARVFYADSPVVHVPAWTSVEYYENTPFIIPLGKQTLRTADNVEVTVQASVWCQITEPILLRAALGPEDWMACLTYEAKRCLSEFVRGNNYLYGASTINDTLSAQMDEAISISSMGTVEFSSLSLEDFTVSRTHRHFGVQNEDE